ncbi:hypothetical protein TNCV_3506761 [Trichonephila clavipes]|uniref:Uncharacterized protein n=1 Tax=Trichonephila clavipes TaxID=2585209 RepID=A0A8X6S6A7_TRICX|nr:hypothetical protein TNCV_3506761 [Trichonephila clavipes]
MPIETSSYTPHFRGIGFLCLWMARLSSYVGFSSIGARMFSALNACMLHRQAVSYNILKEEYSVENKLQTISTTYNFNTQWSRLRYATRWTVAP